MTDMDDDEILARADEIRARRERQSEARRVLGIEDAALELIIYSFGDKERWMIPQDRLRAVIMAALDLDDLSRPERRDQ